MGYRCRQTTEKANIVFTDVRLDAPSRSMHFPFDKNPEYQSWDDIDETTAAASPSATRRKSARAYECFDCFQRSSLHLSQATIFFAFFFTSGRLITYSGIQEFQGTNLLHRPGCCFAFPELLKTANFCADARRLDTHFVLVSSTLFLDSFGGLGPLFPSTAANQRTILLIVQGVFGIVSCILNLYLNSGTGRADKCLSTVSLLLVATTIVQSPISHFLVSRSIHFTTQCFETSGYEF